MARIKNKKRIPLVIPKLDDYFVGSQKDNNGKTVNFDFNSVINTINEVNGFSSISYKFSITEDATIEEGYFNTNSNEVTFSDITTLVINTTDYNGSDLSVLLENLTDNKGSIILYLKDPSTQNLYSYFKISESVVSSSYVTLTVQRWKTLSAGNLSAEEAYTLGFIAVSNTGNSDFNIEDVNDPAYILNKPENTSDFNNDGEGSDRFVEDQELGEVAFSNDFEDLDNKPVFKVIENEYADMTALYADQGNQTDTFIQYVVDASAHPNVTSGDKYFEYLGTIVGDDTDYRLLSNEESAPIGVYIGKTSDIRINDGEDGSSRYVEEDELNSSEVIVKEYTEITNQALDSNKVYLIDGDITIPDGHSIIVPTEGLTVRGYGFNISSLSSSSSANTLFTSPVGGSGDLVVSELSLTASGSGSAVFDIVDVDGTHTIEIEYVNFNGCVSLGKQEGYRQGTWTTVGVYGCSDGLQLSGSWSGYKISNSNCFGFGATGTLFKRDTDTLFSNRVFLNMNVDLPTGAKLADFQPSNFSNNELFQINSSIAKLNNTLNIDNGALLVPNISPNDLKSLWVGNIGLPDSATEAYLESATVTGTYDINWLRDTYFLTMTGDTTFTESNLPASSKNTQEIKVYLTGNFVPTFPTNWEINMVGTYKGADLNEVTIKYIKSGVYFVKISNSLSVYPAPILGSVVPVSLLPSSTSELRLKGSFFTPAGFVLIDGQVVNNIEFDPDTGDYILSVTTGALEEDFDITISNGTSVTFSNKLIVNLGDVFIPTSADWDVLTGSPDLSEDGAVKLSIFDSLCEVVYTTELDISKDFEIRHNLLRSNLSTDETPVFQSIQLIDASTDAVMFYLEYTMGNGDGGHAQTRTASATDSPDFHLWFYPKTITEKFEYFATAKNYFRYISGVMYYYENDVLIRTFTDTLSNNLKLKVRTQKANVNNIKYIELP